MLSNKKWMIALGALGALVLLLAGVGIVYAQTEDPATGGSFSFQGGLLHNGGPWGDRAFDRGMGGRPARGGPFWDGAAANLPEIVASELGLSVEEVVEALRNGQTVAELVETHGGNLGEILEAALAEAEARLSEAVENGRLTEERKAEMLDELRAELPERLEELCQPRGAQGGLLGHLGEAFWGRFDAVAEALGLDPDEFFSRLHSGDTVADIADEQDVDLEEIRDALEEAHAEQRAEAIQQALEEGRISEEQAEWMLEGTENGFFPRGGGVDGRPGVGRGHGGRGGRMGW